MSRSSALRQTLIFIMLLAFLLTSAMNVDASVRFRGSVRVKAYGYEDYDENDHLWLMQSTRFSLYHSDKPVSFHFSGGYIGDSEDDFSESGRGRFLKGYLKYGKYGSTLNARLGRFFLYRGVALGVLDGVEVEKRLNKRHSIAVFGGMMGQKMREFEFEKFDEAMAFGAEYSWYAGKFKSFDISKLSLSYTYQNRDSNLIRHRIGLSGSARINDETRILAIAQLRPTSSPVRKVLARVRYFNEELVSMFELGLYTPDIIEESWFATSEQPIRTRMRFALDHYIRPNRWAYGLEGTVLFVGGNSGYRLGPVVTTPIGQIGYRMQVGELSKSDGPWVNLQYSLSSCLDLYGMAMMTSYEWEEFDIESEDLIMINTGAKFSPKIADYLEFSAEYQVYQTPQFTSDRRFMGGLVWNFDTRRLSK